MSFKDVQIAYLMDGVPAVERLFESDQVSRSTLRKALQELQKSGREARDLEQWVIAHIGAPGRGRSAPSAGEVRTYKAQQVKSGGPFLRLPLDVLGVRKGSVVRVRFDHDQIVVSR